MLCQIFFCRDGQEAADDGGDLAFANALDLGAAPLGYDRLDDDWTLSAQHASNILGGQVRMDPRPVCLACFQDPWWAGSESGSLGGLRSLLGM